MKYFSNTIKAIVTRRGVTYEPTLDFNFGQSGDGGSEYTVAIN